MSPHRKHRSCNEWRRSCNERPHCPTGPTGPSSLETDCFQDIKNTLQHCTGRIVSLLLSRKSDPIQGRISSVNNGSVVFDSENGTSVISICSILSIAPILFAYVANSDDNTVSVINTFTNTIFSAPITVGLNTIGVAITPDGSKAYVTGGNAVKVINTSTNTVVGDIIVGNKARGMAITPSCI
ncbi:MULTISPECIES: YncE family protein [Bacillus cereus group]|uniref:PQQ-dependent protein n=1 Tax=Bacillus cereus TaxID=1396 RepID=A0A2B8TDK5_BACCE|nr:YncE family protein [Bacillus cereus]PDY80616.1 hypothetical protein CON06_20235 [Bacillus cereus]PFA09370.1 hypothetical protein CN382_22325 [Bacillus cereus]PFM41458.1 hypothetical protein COJ43_10380 [Bacillus cereus]PGL64674.1 hypothetical protein CN927_01905 [Bacillus cereus]PGQ05363.1 hypothetical protein COA08_27480 [Bacillus cereus]